jgi:hypothetical protein
MQTQIGTVTRVEAGSNTSTVTLLVVGGDEKRSLKTDTVKYETALARASSIYKRQIRPLVLEGAPGHEPQMGLDTKTY